MKRTEVPLETIYPTRRAWAAGDAAVDALPFTATLQEAIAAWEAAYFAAGGLVGRFIGAT